MSVYNKIAALLTAYFANQFYEEGINALKRDIDQHEDYAAAWQEVVEAIQYRSLSAGQPLELVNYKANQMLDENTDEEAYKWLDLMIQNVQRGDGEVDPY